MIDYNFKNKNLVEITTQRQKQNGTRQFFDRKNRVHYISTVTGYVRREIRFTYGNITSIRYPLNRKNNKTMFLYCENDRLTLIDNASKSYNMTYNPTILSCFKSFK